ncbi:NYN domain-containing protein [Halogeometricum luteum]|uniref:NYN domain-containing protein n=1 Tax=Halogeometricum luteum TaxID=2950537 RepID=A0ABU2G184_9EURY|nr:NYN domain-containing protein [Halogeometricum sp. S3BR5-2]MDS0294536.1 NYN domain-containing protein [Halogeometricum sp. S3BR5-2]
MDRSRRDSAADDAAEAATGGDAGGAGDAADAARTDTDTDIDADADGRTDDGVRAGSDARVALFVDGPNVLREEFDVDLDDLREAAAAFGRPAATRLYLDEHATPGLIQAAEARGFEVVVTSGDVDVRLAVDLTRFAVEGRADVVAVASRDTDFKPAVETANAYGLRTVAIAPGAFGRSDALRNAATESVTLGDDEEGPSMVGYDG